MAALPRPRRRPLRRPGLLLAALGLTLAPTLAGCGGGSDRPTAEELSDSLQHGKAADALGSGNAVDEKVADCMGRALHDSDLSDEALTAIAEGDKDYRASKQDTKALTGLATKVQACGS